MGRLSSGPTIVQRKNRRFVSKNVESFFKKAAFFYGFDERFFLGFLENGGLVGYPACRG